MPGLAADPENPGHSDQLGDCCFPAAYSELFATCSGSDIRIWHTKTKAELLRVQVPQVTCNCISFAPGGNAIYSGWNVISAACLADARVHAIAFSAVREVCALPLLYLGACCLEGPLALLDQLPELPLRPTVEQCRRPLRQQRERW